MAAIPDWVLMIVYFAAIIVITWLVARLASYAVGRLMRESSPQVTNGARSLVAVVVWLVGIVFAVQEIGVSPDVLLVILGLLGVAAIIGLRQELENLGARYFSDVYGSFKTGDSIQVGEHTGKVIEINPMSLVLLSDDDRLVSIPNSVLMREAIVNLSPQAWKKLTVPVTIPSSVDLAAFESELLKSINKLRSHLDKRFPPVFTTKSRTAQSTDLVLTVMIRRPEERDSILAEVNKRVQAIERVRAGAASSPPTSVSAPQAR
jgi:small conductance mechanosensitive channel